MIESASSMAAEIGRVLGAMPDVFSTPQWGGRAFKLPGRGARKDKPILVAHVCPEPDSKAASISFKLPKADAKKVVRDHAWITPHSFRTLAPSGWVTAIVKTKSQLKTLTLLLKASRAMHPVLEAAKPSKRKASPTAHLESALRQVRESGWRPRNDD